MASRLRRSTTRNMGAARSRCRLRAASSGRATARSGNGGDAMRQLGCVVAMVMSAALISAQRQAKALDIYVVDGEGGNASLFLSPSGESLLIDTGNGGMAAPRDAGRIVEAAKDA